LSRASRATNLHRDPAVALRSATLKGELHGRRYQKGSGLESGAIGSAKQPTSALLKEFFDRGKTRDIQGVIGEITSLIPHCNNRSVKLTLLQLKKGQAKSKGVAIISD
jgi:hypothetical protein